MSRIYSEPSRISPELYHSTIRHLENCLLVIISLFPILPVIGISAADIGMSVAAVLYLPILFFRPIANKQLKIIFLLCVGIWLYATLSSFLAPDAERAFKYALIWIRFVLFGFAICYIISEHPLGPRAIIFSLVGYAAFLTGDLWYEYWIGKDIFGNVTPTELRLVGPYGRLVPAIFISHYGLIAIGFLWGRFEQKRLMLLLIPILAGLYLATLFVAGSRMPLMLGTLGIGLLLTWLSIGRYGWRAFLLPLTGVTAILALLAVVAPEQAPRMYDELWNYLNNFSNSPWGMRMGLGIDVWQNYPITGIGIKNFFMLCEGKLSRYVVDFAANPNLQCDLHPHNFFIEWFVSLGTIGGVLYIALLGLLTRFVVTTKYLADEWSAVAKGCVVAAFIFLWPIASTSSFFGAYFGSEIWYLVGLALGFTARYKMIHA